MVNEKRNRMLPFFIVLIILGAFLIGYQGSEKKNEQKVVLSGFAVLDQSQSILSDLLRINPTSGEDYIFCEVEPLDDPSLSAIPRSVDGRALPVYPDLPFDAVTVHVIRLEGTCAAVQQQIDQDIRPRAELMFSMDEPVCPDSGGESDSFEWLVKLDDVDFGVYDAADGGQGLYDAYQSVLQNYNMPQRVFAQENVCAIVAYFSWKCEPIAPVDSDKCEAVSSQDEFV